MTDVRKRIVEAGYNALAENFLEWGSRVEGDPRDRFLGLFADNLPEGSSVLDLGCGAGVSTRPLADRFDVIGVDISETQLRLARRYVPNAHFVRADLAEVAFLEGRLDGIVALYSISHVPRAEHSAILRRFATWLRPDGLFLATLGVGDSPDWTGEWLGVQMFFSSHDEQTNRALLQAAGLELMLAEVVEMREPEGTVSFLWALARKPAQLRTQGTKQEGRQGVPGERPRGVRSPAAAIAREHGVAPQTARVWLAARSIPTSIARRYLSSSASIAARPGSGGPVTRARGPHRLRRVVHRARRGTGKRTQLEPRTNLAMLAG